jgi:hypothetical protein
VDAESVEDVAAAFLGEGKLVEALEVLDELICDELATVTTSDWRVSALSKRVNTRRPLTC